MIIKSYELNKIENNLKFFLFYGKNEGLKDQLIKQLSTKNKDDNFFKYEEKEILENKDVFFENILSNSLFESTKNIIINRSTDKIYEIIVDLMERNINNVKIIINANTLEKKSWTTRIWFNSFTIWIWIGVLFLVIGGCVSVFRTLKT